MVVRAVSYSVGSARWSIGVNGGPIVATQRSCGLGGDGRPLTVVWWQRAPWGVAFLVRAGSAVTSFRQC